MLSGGKKLQERRLDLRRAVEVLYCISVTMIDTRRDYADLATSPLDGPTIRSSVLFGRIVGVRGIISMKKANGREIKKSVTALVDPDDAPELTDEMLEVGVWRIGDRIVMREEAQIEAAKRRGRPTMGATKISTTIRLDPTCWPRSRRMALAGRRA
jgi:hypothetical protein